MAKFLIVPRFSNLQSPADLPHSFQRTIIKDNGLVRGDIVAFKDKTNRYIVSICDNDMFIGLKQNMLPDTFCVGDEFRHNHWFTMLPTNLQETYVWLDVEKYGQEMLQNYSNYETYFRTKNETYIVEVEPSYEDQFKIALLNLKRIQVEIDMYNPEREVLYFPYNFDNDY